MQKLTNINTKWNEIYLICKIFILLINIYSGMNIIRKNIVCDKVVEYWFWLVFETWNLFLQNYNLWITTKLFDEVFPNTVLAFHSTNVSTIMLSLTRENKNIYNLDLYILCLNWTMFGIVLYIWCLNWTMFGIISFLPRPLWIQ